MVRNLAALAVLIALPVTACGGDDSANGVATLESTTTTEAPSTETTTAGEFGEEQALAFSQCMRDQGLDFPDPTVDADGNLTMDDMDMSAFGATPDEIRANLETAMDACGEFLEGMSFGGGQLPDLVELQDTFLEFAACMRDNGYDIPDPDFTGDVFGGFFELGESIDPNDPAFMTAMGECQEIFTRFQQP